MCLGGGLVLVKSGQKLNRLGTWIEKKVRENENVI
jgi:hypothetical protein